MWREILRRQDADRRDLPESGVEKIIQYMFAVETKKSPEKLSRGFFSEPLRSVTTLFGFAAFDFARLFIVPAVTQFLEGSLFVEFFLQPAKGTVDDLAFFDADFCMHWDSPPFKCS